MPKDAFPLDPVDPPPGASEAEILLYAGKCPACEIAAAFAPSNDFDDVLTCQSCGFEFTGTESDATGKLKREVTAVHALPKKLPASAARRLPAVTQRPVRRRPIDESEAELLRKTARE